MKKSIVSILSLAIGLEAVELEPISVLSNKLENSVLDNASTVEIVDEEKIALTHSKNIKELSAVISNANISGIGNRSDVTITLRGISNYLSYESSVAMYVDDVPIPFSYGFGLVDMYNIQSIEILKGGQGTLFGKGAESGVINIYTKAPTQDTHIDISSEYASYNSKAFYGLVSGQTGIKNLGYSLSISQNSSDGYSMNAQTNKPFDTRDFLSFSSKLLYQPNTALSIALNYARSKSDDGGSPYKINTKKDPYTIYGEPSTDTMKMQGEQLSLVVKHEENGQLFSSVSSFSRQAIEQSDYVGILGGLDIQKDIEIKEISQEFKYKKTFTNSDLLLGAYYSNKTQFNYKEQQTLLTLFPIPLSSLNDLNNPDENMAVFTQYKYYIGDNYSIMGGVRYQETKRSFNRELNNFGKPSNYASDSTTWSHILPTVSFSYYGEDNSHSYFTYSQGYRPGGYGYRMFDTLTPFDPEHTDSYELGYKKVWGKGISLNSNIFYNKIKDHRINILNDTLTSELANADQAYSYGLELDFNYQTDNLQLYSSFGWTEAQYTNFSDSTYTPYEGNRLLEVPNITASLGIKYTINEKFYLTSSMRYMGERYYNIQNTSKADAYTTLNLGLGYKKDGWLVELYANNILDKTYVDFMIATPSNTYYHFGAPRVVGIKLKKSFRIVK